MLKRRIRILAVTGITIVATTILTLTTTAAASAATTTASAPGHVTAPQASAAAAGCVTIQFGTWDENTYEPNTYSAVRSFQTDIPNGNIDGITGPQTWWWLCHINSANGFSGAYWHDAGCATEPGSPPS